MAERSFGDLFASAYSGGRVAKTASRTSFAEDHAITSDSLLPASAGGTALGHPEFDKLQIGQTAKSNSVVFFLDVRGFTKLSFVLANEDLLLILQALTTASVLSVIQFGGHVIEFTGDGIMAVFGNSSSSPEDAAFAALHTTAFLMKGVRDDVNTQLKREGEPIRIGIGMEFGEILWSRIGVLGRTQVKPISEATFLAGKLSTSKYTDPWQAKVGADLAAWIPADLKQKSQRYEFTMEGKQYARELFLFDWQAFGKEFQSGSDQLRKRLLARKLSSPITIASITTGAVPVSGSGPRKLKDQPFF